MGIEFQDRLVMVIMLFAFMFFAFVFFMLMDFEGAALAHGQGLDSGGFGKGR